MQAGWLDSLCVITSHGVSQFFKEKGESEFVEGQGRGADGERVYEVCNFGCNLHILFETFLAHLRR